MIVVGREQAAARVAKNGHHVALSHGQLLGRQGIVPRDPEAAEKRRFGRN